MAKKTAVAKKSAAKKPAPVQKKAAAAAKPAKKAARPATKASKPVVRAVPAKPAPKSAPKPVAKPASKPAPVRPVAKPRPEPEGEFSMKSPFNRKELEIYRKLLLNLRDQIVDGISFLAGENLNHSQRDAAGDLSNYGIHMADQGTDNFDREFALSLVSNEQDVLYEIDEALHRIDGGTYGVCEVTGRAIESERLKALPYARCCLEAQTMMERNRKRFKPFQQSVLQPQEV